MNHTDQTPSVSFISLADHMYRNNLEYKDNCVFLVAYRKKKYWVLPGYTFLFENSW